MERRQLEYRLGIVSSRDAPCEEAILDSVNGQGIDDLVHPETSGQLSSFLEQSRFVSTHPANPVLALSKYQRRHEVVITSRTEEVTSPIVNTHCDQRDGVRQSSEREGITK